MGLTTTTTSKLWPRLQILAAAVLFSTGGAVIKGNQFTDWQVASFRCLIAAFALPLMVRGSGRHWNWRTLPISASYAATLMLFAIASKRTTAANAIFLQSISPAYLVFLSPWILRERIKRSDWFLLLGLGLGLALLLGGSGGATATAPDPESGNLLAILSGVSWAFTVIGLRWFSREGDSGTTISIVVAGNVIGFLAGLPFALPVGPVGLGDVGALLYLGIFQISLAYAFMTRALQHLRAFEAATLLSVEPALNPLWAWLIVGEKPAPLTLAGGAVIITASLVNAWWQSRAEESVAR